MVMLKGLREFLFRGSVLDLAVAVVVGAAFGQVVNSLVSDIIAPIIGILGGVPDFAGIKLGPVALGKFLNALLNFIVVGAAVYFLVVLPTQRVQVFRKKAEGSPPPPAEPPEEVRLLREILEELRKKA